MGFILQIAEVRKVVDSELGFVVDGPCGKFEAKVSKGNTTNNNNLLLIWRKYLYEYIQMGLTSDIKIIIK